MKIELHLLQNFAPSCLNRDDTNTPKDCEFGGVRRARISSQCLKRAIRKHFGAQNSVEIGTRTKRLKQKLTEVLKDDEKCQPAELTSACLDLFIETYYSKPDSKRPDETAVLLFLGAPEIRLAADLIRQSWEELTEVAESRRTYLAKATGKSVKKEDVPSLKMDKKIADQIKAATPSPDIALFGRMLAEQAEMRVDGSCQVAQAISTHRADLDMDFFSAVDDLNTRAETGAGMLGVTGFNSACFYRYALIDRPQLITNLNGNADLADQAIRAFLEASIEAIPTGKQNSMAAQNKPDFGLFVVRNAGAPCSLANAFAKPVEIEVKQDEDLLGRSKKALCQHWGLIDKVYGSEGVVSLALFTLGHEDRLGDLSAANVGSVKAAINQTMAALASVQGEP